MRFFKSNFKIIVIVLSAMTLLVGGIFAINSWEKQNTFPTDPDFEVDKTISYNGKTYVYNKNIETFLVIGLDSLGEDVSGDSYRNDKRADFLVLFVFDNDTQRCSAIQINRDTVTEMNILGVAGQKVGTVTQQIALSYSYGNGKEVSSRNTADSVAHLLFDVKVNHYASVTMEAVPLYNDFVGGVELEILDDFTGIDDTLIKG
jgi:anionic cell wall polymer biosynthesis LytR-Cps2A-Psr (LCP) family protein